jgi:hypothetical protein
MNEAAISNILVEVDFIEQSLRDSGQSHLSSNFDRLKLVSLNALYCALSNLALIAGVDSVKQQCSGVSQPIGQAGIICAHSTKGTGGSS